METVSQILTQLEDKIHAIQKQPVSKKAVVGFDGFVDSIRKAVKTRDAAGAHYYNTLVEFAERIKRASGKSGQIETEVKRTKIGGNAPILSAALSNFKIHTTCLGSIEHPIFEPLANLCKTISILPPGESDAIEFDDGKLILSDLGVFDKYDWNFIKWAVGIDTLKSIIEEAQVVALVDWANIIHAGDIWDGILHDVIKPSGRKDYTFFFDLCDPSKRTASEIDELLDLISDFSHYGSVTLGLNTNEAIAIWSALTGNTKSDSIEEAGRFIHYTMNIDNLLIHPVDRTIVFTRKSIIELPGRFVTNPKIQTGGGDNLNAGFILGQLAGFTLDESIILGMVASGSYIQEGKSADLDGLLKYIKVWNSELKSKADVLVEKKPIAFTFPLHC